MWKRNRCPEVCPMSHCPTHINSGGWSVLSSMFNVQSVQCSNRTPVSPLDDLKPPATAGGTDWTGQSPTEEFNTKSRKRHEPFSCFPGGRKDKPQKARKDMEPASILLTDVRALTRIRSFQFSKNIGTTISPAASINAFLKRKLAALSRYGRLGGIVSIVSILPICLDMAGLAGWRAV